MGHSEPRKGRLPNGEDAVEDQTALHIDFQRLAIPLELPRQKTAMGWQAQADAVMRRQLFQRLGQTLSVSIHRGDDNSHAHVRRDTDRHHIQAKLYKIYKKPGSKLF